MAALLADVVELAGQRSVFPSHLEMVAGLVLEHASVRQALHIEGAARFGDIIDQLEQPRDLLPTDVQDGSQ